jgi:cell division protein FtsN
MVKKKRRTAGRRATDRRKNNAFPGWVYMLIGLAVGLAVASAVYVSGQNRIAKEAAQPAQPEPAEAEPVVAVPVLSEPEETKPEPGVTFDFYDMLPNLDVEVFDEAPQPARAQPAPPPPVSRAGIYILQAGSFSQLADANRRKAEMGLLGVRSDIKKGVVNGRTVYRVYTDPMSNPKDVNQTSQKLAAAGIEVMRKRVSDQAP